MIVTTFRSSYTREPTWDIIYKNYKNFNVQDFLTELEPILTREPPWDIIYKNYKNFNVQDFLTELEPILRSEEEASTYVSYDELTKTSKELTD